MISDSEYVTDEPVPDDAPAKKTAGAPATKTDKGEQGARAMAEAFAPLARAAGVEVPEAAAFLAAQVFVGKEKSRPVPQKLVPRIIDALRGRHLLFRRGGEIVYWDTTLERLKEMKPHTFCTWLPSSNGGKVVLHAGERKERDAEGAETGRTILVESDLSITQAQLVLASEDFKASLPEIVQVNPVCLPVMDDELDERGLPRMRLLRPGYDAVSKTFTLEGLSYDREADVRDAVMWVHDLVQFFAWRQKERDFAIWLAGLLTMFGRGLFHGRAPAFFINANIPESGKTLLTWLPTWAVHGSRATKTLMEDAEEELTKYLDSAAKAGLPYVNFDNIDWGGKEIKTALLDVFVQEDRHEIRKMGGQEIDSFENRTMVWGSGNNITLSRDLARRSLMADLWNPLAGTERVLPKEAKSIESEFFRDEGNRRKLLEACWAMVREWDKAGRPMKPGPLLGSFESWARFAPSVVWYAGGLFKQEWDCRIASGNEEIGDKKSRDYARLAQLAVVEYRADGEGRMRDKFEVLVRQFAGLARRHGLEAVCNALWPETTIEAVLACKDYKGPAVKKQAEPVDDLDAWADGEAQPDLTAASEFLGSKSASGFGKAVKSQMHERHFRAVDGSVWSFTNVAGANPRRFLVEKVKDAAE